MDADVLAGMAALNQSINNASQLAAAAGDSRRAQQMHYDDLNVQTQWRNEDKQFAIDQWERAMDWTEHFNNLDYERQKEFIEMAQNYNSPVNQMKLLREAGLNPALAFGQNNASIGVAQSGSHQPANSNPVSFGGMPAQSGYFRAPNLGDPAQSFAAIATAFQAIAQSKKTGVETTQLENTAADLARTIKANADFAVIGARLEQEFAKPERNAKLRKLDQEIAESVANVENLSKTGAYTEALTEIAKIEKLIKDNEKEKGVIELEFLPSQLRALIKQLESQANVNNANAVYSSALAKEVRELLPGKIHLQKAEYDERVQNVERSIGSQWNERHLTLSQIAENEQLTEKFAADAALAYEQIYGVQLDNQQKRSLMKLVKMNLYYDNLNKMKNAVNPVQWVNGFMNLTPGNPAPAQITGFGQ